MADSYNVYLGTYQGLPRDHHAIWIETGVRVTALDGEQRPGGEKVQVTGNIQQGMQHEVKAEVAPKLSQDGIDQTLIGVIATTDLDKLKEICRSIPPPKKQFEGPRRLYPNETLYRCQEWTRDAIKALQAADVLRQ